MSNPSWDQLRGRAAGKWQIPLLALSLVTLPLAIWLLRPNPKSMPLAEALKAMEAFVSGGAYQEAVEVGQVILARPDCVGQAGTPAHLQMGRALFGSAMASHQLTADEGRKVVDHYRQAAEGAAELTPDDYVKLGRAQEWDRQYALALRWFDEALAKGYTDRSALLQHVYVLRRDRLKASPSELTPLLDDFLASVPAERLDLIAWGIEEKLGALGAAGSLDKAEDLLSNYEARFDDSDFTNLFDYLRAWVLFQSGKLGESELALRTLRNRLDADDPVSARAGWLLGRTILAGGEPGRLEEALSFFRNVLTRQADGPYAVASRLGAAEALVSLGKHKEANEWYRFAIDDLSSVDVTGLVDRDVIRASLSVKAEQQREGGDLQAAVNYAELAQSLVDWDDVDTAVAYLEQLGRLQSEFAEKIGSKDGIGSVADRGMFGQAAATYQRLAAIEVSDEELAADAAWQAAELFARSGDRGEAIALFRIFAESRPTHPLVPKALLRIGQLQQAAGRLAQAISAYQECYRRFPKLLEGVRALVPLAQCYVSRGPEDLELAEKTLRIILEESAVFTPEAPEFADALFLLGDVLERRGHYESAVVTLKEAVDRYPGDSRVWRARFLLADSYRQSASALKEEALTADEAGNAERMGDEADGRFASAREAYRELIDEFEVRRTADLNALERVYLRHAYLYEADCYFESRMYREALKKYDRAAALLRGMPSALSAYVQIINCHVFLGEPAEARAALARAQVLADRMKPESFAESISSETQSEWKEYFEWLGRAEVF